MIKNKTKKHELLSVERILNLLKINSDGLRLKDFLFHLGLLKKEQADLLSLLFELVEQGKVISLPSNVYNLAENIKQVVGRLEIQRQGFGFVIPDKTKDSIKQGDVYIRSEYLGDAWHNDTVNVAVLAQGKGKNREGKILKVLKRYTEQINVRVIKILDKKKVFCQPLESKYNITVLVDIRDLNSSVQVNDVLLVKIERKIKFAHWSGKAIDYIGVFNSIQSIEKLIKTSKEIATGFPAEVLQEIELLPKHPGELDFKDRIDLRQEKFVTIDGEDAKDFDDAIFVKKVDGFYILKVAIADVSHYVRVSSGLDKEALIRSNSFYFPCSVEPMFPEKLSNGLCSLNPNVPRLVMVVELCFNQFGAVINESDCYAAVIESKARLTYTQVYKALILNEEKAKQELSSVFDELKQAENLALLLFKNRQKRGSITLNLPEPKIIFDEQQKIKEIKLQQYNFAHQIIEELMIAANEAVSRFLTAQKQAMLYRVHLPPDPEKLQSLFNLLNKTGLIFVPKDTKGNILEELLDKVKGTDQEFIVNRLVLRSMMQAQYDQELKGHFGLASSCYCHFTSPIRRYADIVVHRALKRVLGIVAEQKNMGNKLTDNKLIDNKYSLIQVAEVLNISEKVSREAERDVFKYMSIIYLQDKIGEDFEAVISGITDFGIFVELKDTLIEGMIRISDLTDDFYNYFQDKQELLGKGTGRRFYLGQSLKICLVNVNINRLEIDFELSELVILHKKNKKNVRLKKHEKKQRKIKLSNRKKTYSNNDDATRRRSIRNDSRKKIIS